MGRIASRFARYEPRLRAGRLVLGLLSDLPRKNCWTIAEWARRGQPARHAASAVPGRLGRRCRPGRRARIRRRAPERRGRGAGRRRDRRREERHPHRRRPAPVHRHRRQDRELPGRGLPRLRGRARTRGGGPGAVYPALLDERPGPLPGRRARRGHRLRDQAGTGPHDDRAVPGCRSPRRLGHRGRGLRRQPKTPHGSAGAQHRLCPRGGLLGRSLHRRGEVPRGCPGNEAAETGLAEALGRTRREGAPLLRLGGHRPGRPRPGPPPTADPPQPCHRRTRLLPLLLCPGRCR